MRKKPDTLDEARDSLIATYKEGGKTVVRGKRDGDALSADDLAWLKTKAVFLKANDGSYAFISDAIGVNKSTVKKWFEDEQLKAKVQEVRSDIVAGALKYLRTFAIDLLMELVALARDKEVEPQVRLRAMCEALDRMGISKVAKTESVVRSEQHHEFDVGDPGGVIDQLRENPQLAAKAADKLDELRAIVTEGAVKQ